MQSESRYHYLNDVNYFFKYSEDVVANITNVIIPYVSQFEYYSDENHFNRIIQILLESDHTYEDIYYSLGVYLLSQTDEVEEKMNVIRTLLYNLQRADEAVAQRVLNIMNVLIPPAVAGGDVGDAVSQQELQQMQDFKRVVPHEELAKLQVVAFSELQTDEKSCSICLDEFVPESKLYTIPCKHLFHTDCLKDWVAENYKCPVCRCEIAKYKVDLEDEEDEEENEEEPFELPIEPDEIEDHGDFVLNVYNVDENNVIFNFIINDEALDREDAREAHEEAHEEVHNLIESENSQKYCVERSHGFATHFCQQCNMYLCMDCDTQAHMYANMRYHQREKIELESEDEDDGDDVEKVVEDKVEDKDEDGDDVEEFTENEEK
jgi:hypothetical protein